MIAVRDHLDAFGDCSVAVVTFAPHADLELYRSRLELPFPVLSDPERALYRQLGFPRASWRAVYSVGTIRMYHRLIREGRRARRPLQDARQMGGDVVIGADGRLAAVFRPRSPDDRPSIATLVAALVRA